MRHAKRNGKGRFVKAKNTAQKIMIVLILLSVFSTGAYYTLHQYLVNEFVQPVSAIEYVAPREVEDGRSNKQKAIDYLKDKGFTDEQIFQFTCLMYYENRGYDEYAFYVNKNGSLDRGFMMHNSRTAPYEISNECSFDMYCSLDKFAEYILNGGSWDRWFGYANHCK